MAIVKPTYDQIATNWTRSAGSDSYALVDDDRGSEGEDTDVSQLDSGGQSGDILRYTLSGSNVTAITVYAYLETSGGDETDGFEVDISPDNSTWETVVPTDVPSAVGEESAVFSTLTWTAPSYCYVRFVTSDNATWNPVYLYNLVIDVTYGAPPSGGVGLLTDSGLVNAGLIGGRLTQ